MKKQTVSSFSATTRRRGGGTQATGKKIAATDCKSQGPCPRTRVILHTASVSVSEIPPLLFSLADCAFRPPKKRMMPPCFSRTFSICSASSFSAAATSVCPSSAKENLESAACQCQPQAHTLPVKFATVRDSASPSSRGDLKVKELSWAVDVRCSGLLFLMIAGLPLTLSMQ